MTLSVPYLLPYLRLTQVGGGQGQNEGWDRLQAVGLCVACSELSQHLRSLKFSLEHVETKPSPSRDSENSGG